MKSLLQATRRRARKLRRPRRPAIILMYHCISAEACPWELAVRPADFADHLEALAHRARVLPLGKLVTALDEGEAPDRGVAITFDDGYADNLHAARPILERYGFPATVFVTAGLVGSSRAFWWDDLAQLALASPELPEVVKLDIEGCSFAFDLGPDARIDCSHHRHNDWRFYEPPPTRRHLLLQTLWSRIQSIPDASRRNALCELRRKIPRPSPQPAARRIMDAGEIVELARGGLVDIGAHTMTHPVLAQISVAEQAGEIAESKAQLERMVDRPVRHFAYPHGGRADYSPATVQAVRDANLQAACTTTEDWLRPGSDRYQLPRIHVPPLAGAGFERLLDYWL